jgi:hypothetical protein
MSMAGTLRLASRRLDPPVVPRWAGAWSWPALVNLDEMSAPAAATRICASVASTRRRRRNTLTGGRGRRSGRGRTRGRGRRGATSTVVAGGDRHDERDEAEDTSGACGHSADLLFDDYVSRRSTGFRYRIIGR